MTSRQAAAAVALLLPLDGELVLLLAREERDAADLGEVALEAVERDERAGCRELARRRRFGDGASPSSAPGVAGVVVGSGTAGESVSRASAMAGRLRA